MRIQQTKDQDLAVTVEQLDEYFVLCMFCVYVLSHTLSLLVQRGLQATSFLLVSSISLLWHTVDSRLPAFAFAPTSFSLVQRGSQATRFC